MLLALNLALKMMKTSGKVIINDQGDTEIDAKGEGKGKEKGKGQGETSGKGEHGKYGKVSSFHVPRNMNIDVNFPHHIRMAKRT